MIKSKNFAFIMAGGVGSRFWPKSRNAYPKQFIDILGVGKTLLQLTYDRMLKLCPPENIYIVTNIQYKEIVKQQLPAIDDLNILSETSRNNTAPCIAYSAFKLVAKEPDATMVIAPSDHFILDEATFIKKIEKAVSFANENEALVTLGIHPTRPDTGYGYINFEQDAKVGKVHKVVKFTEKPILEKAVEFINNGNYVWNAGIFIWHVQTVLKAFKTHAPEIFDLFDSGKDVYNTSGEQEFINTNYSKAPNISIDFAILEKANNVFTIPGEFGWSDLGTWASLYEVAEKGTGSNVATGSSHQLIETEDCIIHLPENKLAVIKGLKDFIIVDDKNVLLIYPKKQEQEIKKITEKIAKEGQGHYL